LSPRGRAIEYSRFARRDRLVREPDDHGRGFAIRNVTSKVCMHDVRVCDAEHIFVRWCARFVIYGQGQVLVAT
jgi:hypothetical protein